MSLVPDLDIIFISFNKFLTLFFHRHRHGLVGPRVMVARQESLAYQNEKHAGSVRRCRGCTSSLHADAQNPEGTAAGYALSRLQGRLLRENVQRRDQSLQRIRQVSFILTD